VRSFSKRFWWGELNMQLTHKDTEQWQDNAVALLVSSFGNKIGVFLALPSKFARLMEAEAVHMGQNIRSIVEDSEA
jgi:hypothetical protein